VGNSQQTDTREGEAFELDERLTVVGHKLALGELAPEFALESFDPETSAIQTVSLADSAGQIRVLNVVNSLDTPVCHIETRRWDALLPVLPSDAVVKTVSMDLPFAQARWRAAENIDHQALSSHKHEDFGKDYGVLLKEWRLLQRAVFVIDQQDHMAYAEYVPDQMAEPDYEAAVAIVRELSADD
jgi:thiol peroxidase